MFSQLMSMFLKSLVAFVLGGLFDCFLVISFYNSFLNLRPWASAAITLFFLTDMVVLALGLIDCIYFLIDVPGDF